MKGVPWNMFTGAGWIPYGLKLLLMALAAALELWGVRRKCRERGGEEP